MDYDYTTYDSKTGEFIHVYKLEDCVKAILTRNEDKENKIKRLQEENKTLREEYYKDSVIQELQQKLRKMENDYYRGFPISESQAKKINNWREGHDEKDHGYDTLEKRVRAEGVSGGRYSYIFVPTSIGTSGVVRCSCGAEFEFQEIG